MSVPTIETAGQPGVDRRTATGGIPARIHRLQVLIGSTGALLLLAGLLIDVRPLVLVGAAIAAAAATWTMLVSPEWLILAFVVVRPLFDFGPTYGRGPNLNAVAGAMLLVTIVRWFAVHRHELRRPTASVLAACAFAAAALLSALGSYDPVNSTNQALRVVSIVGLFAIAEQIGRLDPGYLSKVIVAFLGSTVIAASIAAAQIIGFIDRPGAEVLDLDPQLIRPPGPYPAPTVLATHLVMACALLLVVVPRMWAHPRWRMLVPHIVAFAALCLWVLAENKSRSATASLLFVGAVFLAIRWRWVGGAIAVMVVLAAGALLQPSTTRLDELGSATADNTNADTFAWRLDYWQDNLPRWTESPITGIGLGRVEQLHAFKQPPHSTVVQTIVEMGTVGVLGYAAFALLLGRDLWRGIGRTRGRPRADAFMLIALLCISYAFMGLFENLLTQVVTSGPMALLAGAALGSSLAPGPTEPAHDR